MKALTLSSDARGYLVAAVLFVILIAIVGVTWARVGAMAG